MDIIDIFSVLVALLLQSFGFSTQTTILITLGPLICGAVIREIMLVTAWYLVRKPRVQPVSTQLTERS